MKKNDALDGLGVFVSGVCIFHCTVLPIALAIVPALGLQWLNHNPVVHLSLFLLMLTFAVLAFTWRYRLHRSLKPAVWMAMGVLLVGLGHFVVADHSSHHQLQATTARHEMHQGHGMHAEMEPTTNPLGLDLSTWIAVIGGLFLIRGHFLNQKMGCCCR